MSRRVSTYPGGAAHSVTGIRQVKSVTTPAAGAEWAVTLADGYYWRLISGRSTLVTSAAVANRFPGIELFDTNVVLGTMNSQAAIVASLTTRVSHFGTVETVSTVATAGTVFTGAPFGWIEPGFVLRSNTVGIDVADQYSAINLWFECFDFGEYGTPERMHSPTLENVEGMATLHHHRQQQQTSQPLPIRGY